MPGPFVFLHENDLLLSLCQVDPFLSLVDDHKLQAVNSGIMPNGYGLKGDDSHAMKSLSEIESTEDQSREFCASEIVKSMKDLSDVKFLLRAWKFKSV